MPQAASLLAIGGRSARRESFQTSVELAREHPHNQRETSDAARHLCALQGKNVYSCDEILEKGYHHRSFESARNRLVSADAKVSIRDQPIKFGLGSGKGRHYIILVRGEKVGSIRKLFCFDSSLQQKSVRFRVNG